LFGMATQLYCDVLVIQNTGSVYLVHGGETFSSGVTCQTITSRGLITLTEETILQADLITNHDGAKIEAGGLQGKKIKNAGYISIVARARIYGDGYSSKIESLDNSGYFYCRGFPTSTIYVNGVRNEATGELHLSAVSRIEGLVYNYGKFTINAGECFCEVVTNINGQFFNSIGAYFNFFGPLLMNGPNFNNFGNCYFSTWVSCWSAEAKSEFRSPIFNNGTFTFQGNHNIYSSFYNLGICNLGSGDCCNDVSLYSKPFDNMGVCNMTGNISIFGDFINENGSSLNFEK
jgi:hypothetical protein